MMNRAWKYCRQATADEQLSGIKAQSFWLDQYVAEHGFEVAGETQTVEKGHGADRESLLDLLRHAQDSDFDILLVSSLDRLSRDMAESIRICRLLLDAGIRVIVVRDKVELSKQNIDNWFAAAGA